MSNDRIEPDRQPDPLYYFIRATNGFFAVGGDVRYRDNSGRESETPKLPFLAKSGHSDDLVITPAAGLAESSGGRREQRTKDITNPMKIDEQAKVRIDDDWLHRASYAFDGVVFDFDDAVVAKFGLETVKQRGVVLPR